MAKTRCWLGVVALAFAVASPVLGQEPSAAGRIKVVSGSAFIVSAGARWCSKPTVCGPAPTGASA